MPFPVGLAHNHGPDREVAFTKLDKVIGDFCASFQFVTGGMAEPQKTGLFLSTYVKAAKSFLVREGGL